MLKQRMQVNWNEKSEQTHAEKKKTNEKKKPFHGKLCRKVDDDSSVCAGGCTFKMTFLWKKRWERNSSYVVAIETVSTAISIALPLRCR